MSRHAVQEINPVDDPGMDHAIGHPFDDDPTKVQFSPSADDRAFNTQISNAADQTGWNHFVEGHKDVDSGSVDDAIRHPFGDDPFVKQHSPRDEDSAFNSRIQGENAVDSFKEQARWRDFKEGRPIAMTPVPNNANVESRGGRHAQQSRVAKALRSVGLSGRRPRARHAAR